VGGLYDTDLPEDSWKCNEHTNRMECNGVSLIGYPFTGNKAAPHEWCQVDIPPVGWDLKHCPKETSLSIKMITYNLYWWNLFQRHQGSERSAGSLTARTALPEHYDFMAFQEVEDVNRVMQDAWASGLQGPYHYIVGGHAMAITYQYEKWTLLAKGDVDVGEDSPRQYYGKRSLLWARFRHRDGKTVFFANHHGPLRVSEGGHCTGMTTAMNIVRVIANNAHYDDAIVLTGDFNARIFSSRIRELARRLVRLYTGWSMGGVDHFFSNCNYESSGKVLGKGDGPRGSDHDALSMVIKI